MSNSVTISIATNSTITAAKFFGYLVTGSPTLFAETIHSAADVANQALLKVGEIRARGVVDAEHPFGRGQERFFWALVSAVSIFFVGCGVTMYHGVHSLLYPEATTAFTPLAIGLLIFSLLLELYTFRVAWLEIGGWKGLRENRSNTLVLAVLLEDGIAVIGILLTLLVVLITWLAGPSPIADAVVSIFVAVMLGAMAIFLAAVNRKLLIDVADADVNHAVNEFLSACGIRAHASSLVIDVDTFMVFVHVEAAAADIDQVGTTRAMGEAIKAAIKSRNGKTVQGVYWKFPVLSPA